MVEEGNATREELYAKVLLGFTETLGQLGREAQAASYTSPALSVQVRDCFILRIAVPCGCGCAFGYKRLRSSRNL